MDTVVAVGTKTLTRKTTFDIELTRVLAESERCPFSPRRPVVPIAVFKKSLLMDFSLQDAHGDSLALVSREESAYFAWSAICQHVALVLDNEAGSSGSPNIDSHIKDLVTEFPQGAEPQLAWEPRAEWSEEERKIWYRLLDDGQFRRLLHDFTFCFLVLVQLTPEIDTGLYLVKLEYQEPVRLSGSKPGLLMRLGILPTGLRIDVPTVGRQSYHLRVEPPSDVKVTKMDLIRIVDPLEQGDPAGQFAVRLGDVSGEIYTTVKVPTGQYVAPITLRVPVTGYLRSVWLVSVAMAVILLFGRIRIGELTTLIAQRSDAAVALLLLSPSFLTAYLIRPSEHVVASAVLRPTRYAAAVSAGLSYLATGVLVIGWSGFGLVLVWTVAAVTSAAIAGLLTSVVLLSKIELDETDKTIHTTLVRDIRDFGASEDTV